MGIDWSFVPMMNAHLHKKEARQNLTSTYMVSDATKQQVDHWRSPQAAIDRLDDGISDQMLNVPTK